MFIPEGFAEVTPYITVDDAAAYVDFLAAAFGTHEIGRSMGEGGRIANSQLRFAGGAMIMLSDACEEWKATQAAYYLYVENADATMAAAVAAGGTQLGEVGDRDYGDRQGGVRDPAGNVWWVSQRLVDAPYDP